MHDRCHLLLVFTLLASPCCAQEASPLHDFTGAHTRIVWVQDFSPTNGDILTQGQRLKLLGIDSDDGRGERTILGEMKNYAKPLLTPDGQRVVFSDQQTQKFYVVNWDGSGKKLLGDGLAVDVWRDPKDGVDWVYAGKRVGKPEMVTYRGLRRIKLNEPKTSQKVWDQTDVGCDNFQLSADGTKAGGEFPWPNGGVADLTKKTWQKLEQGCWASMAPDNSGLSWVFDGPHRHLQLHRPDQPDGWKVNVSEAPEFNGAEGFHPRWSNHVRYFAMTGPFNIKGAVNYISGGGPQIEIHLGRFSPDFRSVEAWHQVSKNDRADFYPDVWIAGGEASVIELPGLKNGPPPDVATSWPVNMEGLLFAWNNGSQTNQIADRPGQPGRACQIALHGRAIPGRFRELRFLGGTGTLEEFDAPLLMAVKGNQDLTIEMLITPASVTTPRSSFCEIGSAEQPQFRLIQDAGRLHWELKNAKGQVDQPVWKTAAPVVLNVSLSARSLKIYADGRPIHSQAVDVNFAQWTSGAVTLGSSNWRGSLEAITVYSRSLPAGDIERQAVATRQRLTARKPASRYQIQAKCVARSTIPPPIQILPYRRALAVHEFEVLGTMNNQGVKKGQTPLKAGSKILVAQWVILDGQILTESSKPKVGDKLELTIEPVGDHPELESERQILDTEELDLPLYYDVGS